MANPGPNPGFFWASRRQKIRQPHPEMPGDVSGFGEPPPWEEDWSCPPPPRRSRWGPEKPEAEGPGMPPPGWGDPGLGPPPSSWVPPHGPGGRGFPHREGREGPWAPPEMQGIPPQDPRWREWGGPPGDLDGLNSSCREGPWDGPWDGPGPQRWWGPPMREARQECFESAGGSNLGEFPGCMDWGPSGPNGPGKGRDRWSSSPMQEDPGNWNQHPGEPSVNPRRSRWDNPEGWRGEHQSLGREKSWGGPEERQPSPRCEKGDLDYRQMEPRGQHSGSRSQPVREPFQADSTKNEGRWRSMERRGEGCLNPDRNQPAWEKSQSNSGGQRRDIPKRKGGEHLSVNQGKREWGFTEILSRQLSSDGVQQDCGGSTSSEGEESPDESHIDTGMCEQERKEECSDAREVSHERSGSPPRPPPSISPATSKPWTPREQVVSWWMRCQSILKKKMRDQFLAVCPRPTLPDGTAETPRLNDGILSLLGKPQMYELVTGPQAMWRIQDELLDMLAPALTIYEMTEEAMETDAMVDPMELREWARQLVRHIGSINARLTMQRRWHVLHVLNPRLKSLSSKMIGQSTNGMLFAEDKAKLLQEIIKRFPQLSEIQAKPATTRKKVPFKNTAANKWKQSWPPVGHYKPKGSHSSRSSTGAGVLFSSRANSLAHDFAEATTELVPVNSESTVLLLGLDIYWELDEG